MLSGKFDNKGDGFPPQITYCIHGHVSFRCETEKCVMADMHTCLCLMISGVGQNTTLWATHSLFFHFLFELCEEFDQLPLFDQFILSALSSDWFDQFSQCYPADCTDRRLREDTQWISSLIMDVTFLQTGGIILLRSPWSSGRHLQDTDDLLEWQTFPGQTWVSLTQFNLGKSSLLLQSLYLNHILFFLSITP